MVLPKGLANVLLVGGRSGGGVVVGAAGVTGEGGHPAAREVGVEEGVPERDFSQAAQFLVSLATAVVLLLSGM